MRKTDKTSMNAARSPASPALSAFDRAGIQRTLDAVFGIDLRTLALFRFLLGSVLFVDLCKRALDLRVFYTDFGVMPRDWAMNVNGLWRISLHLANGEAWFIGLLFAIEMIAALGIALGWRARRSIVVAFVLHTSLLNRDQLVLLGGDILITCLMFWAMFLPIAARWSVDAALSRTPPPADNTHCSFATAGLLLQVLSVYFFSAILKNGREWWPEGTAVDYAMQIDAYATPVGQWLRHFPQLEYGLTLFVYFLELLGPPLALFLVATKPLRFVVMVLLMCMHIGFIFCLNLGPFPWISLTSLTTLAGGWLWDLAARRRAQPQSAPLRIYYDRDCGFCLKSVLLFRTFLALPQAEIAPAQDNARARGLMDANYSWVVIDHDERAYLKWPAFVVLLKRSPLFGWLGVLLSGGWAVAPANRVYDFVGRHRGAFGRLSAWALPFHERPYGVGPVAHAFAAFMVVVLLAWNFCTVHWLPNRLYAALTPPLRALRVDQYWDMFAPYPSKEDGWFVLPAQLVGGREIDLMHAERAAVSYDKPASVANEYVNIRWHKYLERIWSAQFSASRLYYGKYLCRSWNATHHGDEALKSFKIVYMLEMSVPIGQSPSVERRVIWEHECFASSAAAGSTGGVGG